MLAIILGRYNLYPPFPLVFSLVQPFLVLYGQMNQNGTARFVMVPVRMVGSQGRIDDLGDRSVCNVK